MLAPGPSLADQAESSLRREIVQGIWPPMARLRLDDLKSRYAMGSSPLREALSRLMGEGLVRKQNNCGVWVADLSRQDLEEIEWMRVAVECSALRESIARGGRDWEGGIVAALHRLTVATRTTGTDRASLDAWNDEHDAFHAALIACCGNSRALDLQRRLADQHRRYRIALMGENMLRDEIVEEHRGVAVAALKRDVETAVDLLARNMRVTTNFYAAALRELVTADA